MFQNATDGDFPTLGVRFIDCNFEDNISNFRGGAMWMQDTRVELANVRIIGNECNGPSGSGGGVYSRFNTSLSLQESKICGNSPDDFGGVGELIADGMSSVCSEDILAGDITGDGIVNAADLGLILSSWGPCPPSCTGDLNGDGTVNAADLGLLLANWTF